MEEPKYSSYPDKVDIVNCDDEPIHLIPHVQGHACLIACKLPGYEITHVSENIKDKIGFEAEKALATTVDSILDQDTFHQIDNAVKENLDFQSINPIRVGFEIADEYFSYNLVAHIFQERLILEFEPYDKKVSLSNYQYQLSKVLQRIQGVKELSNLYQTTADQIKELIGYDRVMVYKFDDLGNGKVIAEAKNEDIKSFLGLNYPASDIPKQARALFLKNKVRLVSDVFETPVPILSIPNDKQKPLDLSKAISRGVSPIHIEYLKNMGVSATLSIAIELNDDLWGLFACHNYSPKYVSFDLRTTCGFIGQLFSGHLMLHAANDYQKSVLQLGEIKSQLFEQMSEKWNIVKGLTQHDLNLTNLFDCAGACIITEGNFVALGDTPSKENIIALVEWLNTNIKSALFETNHLSGLYPTAKAFEKEAAGILAIRILPEQSNYIIWFRKEVIQEVDWGGNPEKAIEPSADGLRLSPRKSFEKWKELIKGQSIPWEKYEIEAAQSLKNDIKDFIFEKYKEAQGYNKELTKAYKELESFSYSVSHDLRAPLRNIKGFAEILMEDYKGKLDDYGENVLTTIISSSEHMNSLINDVLKYSKIGQTSLIINELDLGKEVRNIFDELFILKKEDKLKYQFTVKDDLPKVYADATLFRQVLLNLISNAVKYSSTTEKPIIEIGGQKIGNHTIEFYIKDNGIGFDQKHEKKIFNVFTRLVGNSTYEGNGVGLAIVKRIIDKHEGEISVISNLGKGTTFFIKLPIRQHIYD